MDNPAPGAAGHAETAVVKDQGRKCSDEAVERARSCAMEWLEGNTDGYPRSWQQENADDKRRGYVMYDDPEAPPIAGYEALERDGLAVRLETVHRDGQERIHFRRVGDPSHASTRKPVA